MNTKEKAEDLVNQYRMILMDEDTECGNEVLCTLISIKSAKVAVKEIIEYIKKLDDYHKKSQVEWWEKVIIELDSF